MSDEPKKSKRGGKRPGAGRKPKSAASPVSRGTKPKRKSPSAQKRAGIINETPAEQAHEWLMNEAESADKIDRQEPLERADDATTLGRPTLYKDEFAAQAEKLCRFGATDVEIAEFFDVDVRTIYRWVHKHEAFCQALRVGKDACDDRVERSLYHRAVGFKHDAVKIFMPAGAAEPVYAPFIEHVPPDVGAATMWLKNRRGAVWRDKQEHIHTFKPDQMSDDDLATIAAGGSARAAETARNTPVTH